MSSSDADREGFRDGLESSKGDPRLLFVLNLVLSTLFAWLLVAGADFIGAVEFGLAPIVVVAALLFVLTYVITWP